MKRFDFKASLRKGMSVFSRLKSIGYSDPELTPETWCEEQPCMKIKIVSREFILTQPTSTFLVYLLGVLTIVVGLYFLWIQDSQVSRLWWGVSLLLWGIGAILAGTSYQAFGYEIKCAGRQSCAWTSWWEVIYLIFQQASMSAILVAVACSSTTGFVQKIFVIYALLSLLIYITITLVGGIVPVKSFITFELMVWVSIPIFLLVLILTGWRYYMLGTSMDLALLGSWLFLLLISVTYYVYDHFDITEKLWARGAGVWFSQNDVLHLGLILWVTYIATVVANLVHDYSAS